MPFFYQFLLEKQDAYSPLANRMCFFHQMSVRSGILKWRSLNRCPVMATKSPKQEHQWPHGAGDRGVSCLMFRGMGLGDSHMWCLSGGVLYSGFQCIMGNSHMGMPTPPDQNDRQTPVKTLPSHNFVGGRQKYRSRR